jgi:hypothetical protein
MKESEIKVNYGGIDIAYDEQDDKWTFTLRGVDRSAKTLANARKAIDAPIPVDKKPFTPVTVYNTTGYGRPLEKITLTSVANKGRYEYQNQLWMKDKNGDRRKVGINGLYVVNEHNEKLHAEILAKYAEADKLRRQAEDLLKKMTPFKLPEETENTEGE